MPSPTADPAVLSCRCRGVGSLGRPTCQRGDLVSQRREEPNARSQASFDRNEGENTRCFGTSVPILTGNETQGARSRPRKEAERSAGAADRVLRGAAGNIQLARRVGAGFPGHAGERRAALWGQLRHAVALRRGRAFRAVAMHNPPPACAEERRRHPVIRYGPKTALAVALRPSRRCRLLTSRRSPRPPHCSSNSLAPGPS